MNTYFVSYKAILNVWLETLGQYNCNNICGIRSIGRILNKSMAKTFYLICKMDIDFSKHNYPQLKTDVIMNSVTFSTPWK